jgi:hypothetical protein
MEMGKRIRCKRKISRNEYYVRLPSPHLGRNLVLAAPIDTSGETSYAQVGDVESDDVLRVLLVTVKPNPRSHNPYTNEKQPTTHIAQTFENDNSNLTITYHNVREPTRF